MAEMERVRERERPPLQDNDYERSMRARAAFMERNMTGPVVVPGLNLDNYFLSDQDPIRIVFWREH